MTKTKSKKRPARECEHYVFEMFDPRRSYSWAINGGDLFDGLYWEHASIDFSGACIWPERLKGEVIAAALVGARVRMDPPSHHKDWRPTGIGMLELNKRQKQFYAQIPMHSFWPLSQAIERNELRVMVLYGPALYRGKSMSTSMNFEREFDPEIVV